MENIKKYHPLLSKCNDATDVKGSVQDIVKILFWTNKVADVCSTPVVTPYLLAEEKSLLALLAYPNCTDGVLYCLPYLFDVSEDLVLYVRYKLLIIFFLIHVLLS